MKHSIPLGDQPYPVWICDLAESRIVNCNDAACRFLNMPRDAIATLAPADLGLVADMAVARIGLHGGPRYEADIRREDVGWQGQTARLIAAFFRPQPVPEAQGDSPYRIHALMNQAMSLAGCVLIEADDDTGDIHVTPEIAALLGLPADQKKLSPARLLSSIHPDDRSRYLEARSVSAGTGGIFASNVRLVRPDGGVRHVRVIDGTDIESGRLRFGLFQDRTDAVLAAEREHQGAALVTLICDLARAGGWRRQRFNDHLEVTKGVYEIAAMPEGPFDVEVFFSCFDDANREALKRNRERVYRDGIQVEGEHPMTALDGTRKWVRIVHRPVVAPDGQITGIVGAVLDITQAVALGRQADQARLLHILENLPDAFYLLDKELAFTYANAKGMMNAAKVLGPNSDIIGKSYKDVFPSFLPELSEPLARIVRDGQEFTVLLEHPGKGHVQKLVVFATPEGIGIHDRDVSKEMRAQVELEASRKRYEIALKASRDVIFEWDILEDTLTWSDSAKESFGYDPTVFPRSVPDWLSIIHPGDRDRMKAATDASVIQEGTHVNSDEYRMLRADGTTAHVFDRAVKLLDPEGRPVRMIGTISDVTALREEEQRLRAMIDLMVDTLLEYDHVTKVATFSEGIRRIFGHDWVGSHKVPSPWGSALHPEDREAVITGFAAFCEGTETKWDQEYRFARADGSFANVRERAVAVRDENGSLIRIIRSLEDITQQRRTEEQARQAERIESIGQLTGGVAHDFNNLLTVILGSAELLEAGDRPNVDRHELATIIIRAAERGAELTAGLLAFAEQQPLVPKTLDTGKAMVEIKRLLERTLPANISLRFVEQPDLWLVEADPAQFNAAILNLCVNARDAMPGGGKLLIECANARLDEAFVKVTPDARTADFLRITVTDSGTGMSAEVASKVFEPFFTTKSRGSGTGMGLSMVRGFVQQSGGHVQLYTEPGQGTTVSLYLPRSLAAGADVLAEPAGTALAGQGEHILVVEDNTLLLPLVTEMITNLGYRVTAAEEATAAMAILRSTDDIDLLFSDVVLPGDINGPKLAQLALAVRPDLKVLLTSGYTENAIIHQGRVDPSVELLSKPYRRNELAQKLRSIIDRT